MILNFSGWVESLINNAPPDRDGEKDEARFEMNLGIPELAHIDLPEIENKTVECLPNN